MSKTQPALCLFVAGLIGLGIAGIITHDFALVWQPVPEGLPARAAVATATALLMLLLGIGLMIRKSRAWSSRILFMYLIVWASLKIPAVVVAPKMEAVWLGLGELVMLLCGGWTLFARLG